MKIYSGIKVEFDSNGPRSPPVRPLPLALQVTTGVLTLITKWRQFPNSERRWAVRAGKKGSVFPRRCAQCVTAAGACVGAVRLGHDWTRLTREVACGPGGRSSAGGLCFSSCVLLLPLGWCPSRWRVEWDKELSGGKEDEAPPFHHRKVSVVELPPGVSGLTSTLTHATFS